MMYKNFWGINTESRDDLKYTDNIYKIMDEQCKYLFKDTQGKVFAVFGEIKLNGTLLTMAKAMSDVFKGISGLTSLQETVDELSTKELIDADSMYIEKNYGFEICTDKYRFRLFELHMTPIYPIEIIVDEGICKNIENILSKIAISTEKDNCFKITDEEKFCEVLQNILQDKKVQYIIRELQKRALEIATIEETLPDKVILCEGRTEEVILQAIVQKMEKHVTIVTAEGKYSVPAYFDAIKGKNTKSRILIVVDSDGNEETAEKVIREKLGDAEYELAIVKNCIEDWFAPDIEGFSKLKLMQSIGSIIDKIDFGELSKKHESFKKVVEFICK